MKTKKRLGILVVALLLVCVFGAVMATVYATPATAITLTDGSGAQTVIPTGADASGTNWSYVAETNTLTLNGWSGKKIQSNGDFNLHLKGTNTITMADGSETRVIGIDLNEGGATVDITADAGGVLNITDGGTALTKGFFGIYGDVTMVSGTVNIDITSSKLGGGSAGVWGSVYLADNTDAAMNIEVTSTDNSDSSLYGVNNGNLYHYPSRGTTTSTKFVMNVDVHGEEKNRLYGMNVYVEDPNADIDLTINIDAIDYEDRQRQAMRVYYYLVGPGSTLKIDGGTVMTNNNFYEMRFTDRFRSTTPANNAWYFKDFRTSAYNRHFYICDMNGNILKNMEFAYSEAALPQLDWIGDDVGFAIPELKIGDYIYYELTNYIKNISDYYYNYYYNTGLYYEIVEGSFPEGVGFNASGVISGSPEAPCAAGTVKIRATDKMGTSDTSDDRSIEFTVSYGKVTTNNPVVDLTLDKDILILDNKGTGTVLATVTPADAAYPNVKYHSVSGLTISVSDPVDGVSTITVKANGDAGAYTLTIESIDVGLKKSITVYVKEETPEIELEPANNRLDGFKYGKTYKISAAGVEDYTFTSDGSYVELKPEWSGKDLTIVCVSDVHENCTSDAQVLGVTAKTVTVTDGAGAGTYLVGSTVQLNANDAPEGYKFVGWSGTEGLTFRNGTDKDDDIVYFVMPNADVNVTANYEKLSYKITFKKDDDTEISSATLEYGAPIAVPADPTKVGHTFLKWDIEIPATMPAQNLTVIAQWTVNKYTITFDTAGGTAIDPITLDYGAAITKPADPTKTDYVFTGWDVAIPATMPAEDITITAIWTEYVPNTYTVTYTDGVGGTAFTDKIFVNVMDGAVTPSFGEDPVRAGYTFAGWSPTLADTVTDNVTYVAQWTEKTYTITFVTNGGTEIDAITLAYGAAITEPADPTKVGHRFEGWDITIPSTMPAENLTITAVWAVNQYTIIFNTEGGSSIHAISQNYGTAITAPADPTKTGYTFAGWDVAIPSTMPAENLTITASWTINQYTITFVTDGGTTIAPITQDFGTAITAPADPVKLGHTFDGWDAYIPSTMPAENLTITAEWDVNQYTITFDTAGGNPIAPITLDFGAAITAPATPARGGYAFAGWDKEIPATMPAENLTITASWTIKQYTITFDTDGGSVIAPITQDFGTAVTAPADPTRTGYTFAGWAVAIPATMPANNLTVKALWTPLHEHTAVDSNWQSDETHHWHVCSCDATLDRDAHSGGTATCTAKAKCSVCDTEYGNLAEHEDTNTDGKCDACDHDMGITPPPHTHTYGTEWQKNETNHWKECSCGEKAESAAHADGNTDGACDTCGYAMSVTPPPHTHTYGTEWQKNETNHWKECSCGEKAESAAHADGNTDGACDTCGYAMSVTPPPHTHTYGTWISDGTNHWKECSCGEKAESAAHSGGTATCTAKAKCSVCEAEYGNLAEHSYSEATCTAKAKCTACGAETGELAEHSYSEATCTAKAKCTACGAETGELAEHKDTDSDGKCDACDFTMSVTPENPENPEDPEDPTDPGKPEEPKQGISGGAIAGIVIGSVVVLGGGGFALFWFVIKKKTFADLIGIFKK